jgi:hypothetical protein
MPRRIDSVKIKLVKIKLPYFNMTVDAARHGIRDNISSSLIVLALVSGCDSNTQQGISLTDQPVADQKTVNKPVFPFVDVTQKSGVSFIHDNGGTGRLYMPEIMGAGGALLDIVLG